MSQESAAGEETKAEIPIDMVVVRWQEEVHLYSSMCPSIFFEVEEMAYVRQCLRCSTLQSDRKLCPI